MRSSPLKLVSGVSGHLRRKSRGKHGLAVELNLQSGAEIERLALERSKPETVKSAIILGLSAAGHFGREAVGEGGRCAPCRRALPGLARGLSDIWNVNQIDGAIKMIGDQLGISDEPERIAEVGDRLAAAVEARPFRLSDQCQPDGRAGSSSDYEVAQFGGESTEIDAMGVCQSIDALNRIGQRGGAELIPEVLRGDVFVFDFLFQRGVVAPMSDERRGGFELDRLLALRTDVRALGEAKKILVSSSWKGSGVTGVSVPKFGFAGADCA